MASAWRPRLSLGRSHGELAFVSEKTGVAVAGNTLRLFDKSSNAAELLTSEGVGVAAYAVHQGRGLIAVAVKALKPVVYVYRVAEAAHELLSSFEAPGDQTDVTCLAFSKDGARLAVCFAEPDHAVCFLEWETKNVHATLLLQGGAPAVAIAFHPYSADVAALVTGRGALCTLATRTLPGASPELVATVAGGLGGRDATCLAWARGAAGIWVGTGGGEVVLLAPGADGGYAASAEPALPAGGAAVRVLAVSKRHLWLGTDAGLACYAVAPSSDQELAHLCDVEVLAETAVTSLAFSPQYTSLLIGTAEGAVRMLENLATIDSDALREAQPPCVPVSDAHSSAAMACALPGFPEVAFTAGHDGYVRAWDTKAGRCMTKRMLAAPLTCVSAGKHDVLVGSKYGVLRAITSRYNQAAVKPTTLEDRFNASIEFVVTGRCKLSAAGSDVGIKAIAHSASGTRACVLMDDNVMHIFNVRASADASTPPFVYAGAAFEGQPVSPGNVLGLCWGAGGGKADASDEQTGSNSPVVLSDHTGGELLSVPTAAGEPMRRARVDGPTPSGVVSSAGHNKGALLVLNGDCSIKRYSVNCDRTTFPAPPKEKKSGMPLPKPLKPDNLRADVTQISGGTMTPAIADGTSGVVLCAQNDGTLRVLNTAGPAVDEIASSDRVHDTRDGAPLSVCLMGNGKSILTAGSDGTLFVFDVPRDVAGAIGERAASEPPLNATEDAEVDIVDDPHEEADAVLTGKQAPKAEPMNDATVGILEVKARAIKSRIEDIVQGISNVKKKNENAGEREKLDEGELLVNIALKEQLELEGTKAAEEVRVAMRKENATNALLYDRVRKSCYASMDSIRPPILPIVAGNPVHGFTLAMESRRDAMRKKLILLRRVELIEHARHEAAGYAVRNELVDNAAGEGEDSAPAESPGKGPPGTAGSPPAADGAGHAGGEGEGEGEGAVAVTGMAAALTRSATAFEVPEADTPEDPPAHLPQGSVGEAYRACNVSLELGDLLYAPFDLAPPRRRITQAEVLVDIAREQRKQFNKFHDKIREVKLLHMDKIADAHARMREIADEIPTLDGDEIDLSHLVDPDLSPEEEEGENLDVRDSEISAEKWISPEERERIAKKAAEDAALEGGSKETNQRALKQMMDGRLDAQSNKYAENAPLEKPEWMNGSPKEFDAEQLKQFKEWEMANKLHNEEREKKRKALEGEMRKLDSDRVEFAQKFDTMLQQLAKLRLRSLAGQNELEVMASRLLVRVEEGTKQKKELLAAFDVSIEQSKAICGSVQGRHAACRREEAQHREIAEHAAREDKDLDKSFKREAVENEGFTEVLLKLFRRRTAPKLQVSATAKRSSVNAPSNLGKRGSTSAKNAAQQSTKSMPKEDQAAAAAAAAATEVASLQEPRRSTELKPAGPADDPFPASAAPPPAPPRVPTSGVAARGGSRRPSMEATEDSTKNATPVHDAIAAAAEALEAAMAAPSDIDAFDPLVKVRDFPEGLEDSMWDRLVELRRKKYATEIESKRCNAQLKLAEAHSAQAKEEELIQLDHLVTLQKLREGAEKRFSRDLVDLDIPFRVMQGFVETFGTGPANAEGGAPSSPMPSRRALLDAGAAADRMTPATAEAQLTFTDYEPPMHHDLDRIILPLPTVEATNEVVRYRGDKKLDVLRNIKEFKRGIYQQLWETKRLDMEAEDLVVQARDLQLLRVTKSLQVAIREGDTVEANRVAEVQEVEARIDFSREVHARRVAELKGKERTMQRKIDAMVVSTDTVAAHAQTIGGGGAELSPNSTSTKLKPATAIERDERKQKSIRRRMRSLVTNRRLKDIADAQSEEAMMLRAELERLRMRTFPTFGAPYAEGLGDDAAIMEDELMA